MAKINKKGLRLIDIIIAIIAIVIVIAIVANINKKKDNTNKLENSVVDEKEQKVEEKNVIELEDGTKLNVSSKLNENKALGDLAIKNIQLTYKDGVTNILATVENIKKEKIPMTNVSIQLLDENGKEIYTLNGIIEETKAGETASMNCSITADFANAYDFEIVKKEISELLDI